MALVCFQITSGVPERNGSRHASELARVAISMSRAVGNLQCLKDAGFEKDYKIELRTGIGTGKKTNASETMMKKTAKQLRYMVFLLYHLNVEKLWKV